MRKDGSSACCVNVMELVMKEILKMAPPARISNGGLVWNKYVASSLTYSAH